MQNKLSACLEEFVVPTVGFLVLGEKEGKTGRARQNKSTPHSEHPEPVCLFTTTLEAAASEEKRLFVVKMRFLF